jgi:hypothetical protein
MTGWAGLVPGPDLARRINESDAIVVATIRSGTTTSVGDRTWSDFVLHIHRVLKGSVIPGMEAGASLKGRGAFVHTEALVRTAPPLHGIWYLKSSGGGFEVVSRAPDNGELHLAGTWLPDEAPPGRMGSTPAESVTNEIISALRWLAATHADELKPVARVETAGGRRPASSTSGSFGGEMMALRDDLRTLPHDTILTAYRELADDSSPHLRVIGVAGLISLNDAEGPKRAAAELKSLSEATDVSPIVDAVFGYYNASDAEAVRAIGRLAEMQLAKRLTENASYALRVLHTREAAPALIAMLDSDEPTVRANALAGICLFVRNAVTVSPDSVRTMSWMAAREPTPFRTAETDRYCWMGGPPEEAARATDHVAFWKAWWREHAAEALAER